MPIWNQTQIAYYEKIKAFCSRSAAMKIIAGEPPGTMLRKRFEAAGIEILSQEVLLSGPRVERPFDPVDKSTMTKNGVRRKERNLSQTQANSPERLRLKAEGKLPGYPKPAAAPEVTQAEEDLITEEEKKLIVDNYRRTSQGLAPLGPDGSRPPADTTLTDGEVAYWAERAKAIGVWKPRTPRPPPTGSPKEAFIEHQKKLEAYGREVAEYEARKNGAPTAAPAAPAPAPTASPTGEEIAMLSKLAGETRPVETLDPKLERGLRDAAKKRFGKEVTPQLDAGQKLLFFEGKCIGVGDSWEESFDMAQMAFDTAPPVSTGILTEKTETNGAGLFEGPSVAQVPSPAPAQNVAPVPVSDRYVDKLGELARHAAALLGHKMGKVYRGEGDGAEQLISACEVCGGGIDVRFPVTDNGSNIRGKAYTTTCAGGA